VDINEEVKEKQFTEILGNHLVNIIDDIQKRSILETRILKDDILEGNLRLFATLYSNSNFSKFLPKHLTDNGYLVGELLSYLFPVREKKEKKEEDKKEENKEENKEDIKENNEDIKEDIKENKDASNTEEKEIIKKGEVKEKENRNSLDKMKCLTLHTREKALKSLISLVNSSDSVISEVDY
jgi:hypothetical protein